MSLNYSGDLILRAKELRKTATPQERHLWYDFLSRYPVRFQRQKTVGRYIVDFYCHRARLVVELDGSQHYEEQGIARDAERTTYLMQQGLLSCVFPMPRSIASFILSVSRSTEQLKNGSHFNYLPL